MNSIFCNQSTLHNEADVEQFFVMRLLKYLHYPDASIRPKESLSSLLVGGLRGMPQKEYKPDFALKKHNTIYWIIEAKSPSEDLNKHIWQPKGYCMLLNGEFKDNNPTKYYMLTNGLQTRVYRWDRNAPDLELQLSDFNDNNTLFNQLCEIFDWNNLKIKVEQVKKDFCLIKESLNEVNLAFAWCHQHIYRKDNISQSDAFSEFVKLISLKLLSDKSIKEKHPELIAEKLFYIDKEEVTFSTYWIDKEKAHTPNPISDIQFNAFATKMEREIGLGVRKRFFNEDELINLKPETIYGVVKRLEKIYLFGIDADLNGRLFETFLNATMRGKDLGQFFTPRSIVKLGVGLAQIKVAHKTSEGITHTDTVIDACCGTGGFLIDVLAEMMKKVDLKSNLSRSEKEELKAQIKKHNIVGIDVGKGPNLSRVARLNMYLHGDGGTNIFNIDALDKDPQIEEIDGAELAKEKAEYKNILSDRNYFDVAITNPPFAKVYERDDKNEERIIDQYVISRDEKQVKRPSIKSSLMFFERYHDILKEGGRLITVIDDGILSGREYAWFRAYLRSNFLVRAIISLPGDAFQRSKARVKTSYMVLEKRVTDKDQDQPPVFMYGCQFVGNDDPSRQRTLPIDAITRQEAKKEIAFVCEEYTKFLSGNGDPKYIVAAENISDRLDVKNCWLRKGRSVASWRENNYTVKKVDEVLELKEYDDSNSIITSISEEIVTQIIVRYNGDIEAGEDIAACDTQYSRLYIVNTGDIVISNIAASYGSVSVVPEELDGGVVSNEYTVLTAIAPYNPKILKHILRSPEIRSEILLSSTGSNRTRIQWENLRNISLVYPNAMVEKEMLAAIEESEKLERLFKERRTVAQDILNTKYDLDNRHANDILSAFKPPK